MTSRLAVLAVAAALLAGCGSTVTVTRTVRDRPCGSVKRMERCIGDITRYTATRHGLNASRVRVACKREGAIWSCLVFAPTAYGDMCGRIPIETTTEVGIPYPADGVLVSPKECDTAFGKA